MNNLQAVLFGLVEGITEFLPISSTGHLMLTGHVMGLTQTPFLKCFEIVIQFGAILSVVFLYRRSFLVNMEVLKRVVVAFIPTGILGLTLYKIVKKYLLSSSTVVLWSLLLGGIFLIVFELLHKEKDDDVEDISTISYKSSVIIGLFQAIAMVPGVSRSASTIVGGLALGLKRKTIVEFSFLLAVPTMLAATGLDLVKNANLFSLEQIHFLAIGFVVSFFAALGAVKYLLNFIKNHTFIPFGIYRVALVAVFWYVMYMM